MRVVLTGASNRIRSGRRTGDDRPPLGGSRSRGDRPRSRDQQRRYELIKRSAVALGLDADPVQANLRADAPAAEPRPADLSLDTTKLESLLPGLRPATIEQALT